MLICLSFLLGGYNLEAQNVKSSVEKAEHAMSNGFFEDAILHYQSAYEQANDIDSILYYKAQYLDAWARAGRPGLDSLLDNYYSELESGDILHDTRSQIYCRLGWIVSRSNQFDHAFELADSALNYAKDPFSRGLALSLKGTLQSIADDQEEGALMLMEAVENFDKIGYTGKDYGLTLMNISNCYAAMGESVKSGDYLSMAYPSLMSYYGEQHPNYYLVKLFYSRELIERQEFVQADALLKEVLQHFQAKGDAQSMMHCYHNLTENSLESGDYQKTLNYLQINLGLSKEYSMDTTYNYGAILNTLVACLRDLEKYEEAFSRLEELELLCNEREVVSKWFYHWVHIHRALILTDQGQYHKADSTFKAIESYIARRFGMDSENMADLNFFRAENFRMMGEYEKALDYLERSAKYYESNYAVHNHTNINTDLLRGKIFEGSGALKAALDQYLSAKSKFDSEFGSISVQKDIATDIQTVIGRDEVYVNLFRLLAKLSRDGDISERQLNGSLVWLEEAKAYYNLLISELYQVTDNRSLIEQFDQIGAFGQEIYYYMYQQENDPEYLWDALSLAELTKTYARKIILNDRNAKRMAHIPDSLLEKDKQFNRRVQYLEKVVQEEQDEEAKYQLNRLRNEWDQFIKLLESDYPEYYQLKYDPYTATGRDMQEWASKGDLEILYFFKGEESLITYKVNESGIDMHLKEDIGSLDSIITAFRAAMQDSDVKSFYNNGRWLNDQLFHPWVSTFSHKKICIVPDKALAYLNFEVLPISENSSPQSFQDMQYIIEDFNLFYRYEFTTAHKKENMLKSGLCENGLAFVPVFESNQHNDRVISLPWSVKLADYLGKKFQIRVFEGQEATTNNFFEYSGQADLLHFSTHAFTSDELPMESYLLFKGENDKLDSLTALDVIQSDLNARLALLSACETGLSEYKVGFGLQSLSWSFEYAGCENLLVSLWSIDDEKTTEILESFYSQLGSSTATVTQALRNAKLAALKQADIHQSNPYYWGGMIYIGNDTQIQIVEASSAWNSPIYYGLLILLILAGIFFLSRKRVNA